MSDPREHNLPKWAQKLLRQERLKSALCFPEAPRPPADFKIGGSGEGIGTPTLWDCEADALYSIIGGRNEARLAKCWVARGYIYGTEDCKGIGSRGNGEYWIDERDAILALRWDVAMHAAERLVQIQTGAVFS